VWLLCFVHWLGSLSDLSMTFVLAKSDSGHACLARLVICPCSLAVPILVIARGVFDRLIDSVVDTFVTVSSGGNSSMVITSMVIDIRVLLRARKDFSAYL